jgi:hypothetical protein
MASGALSAWAAAVRASLTTAETSQQAPRHRLQLPPRPAPPLPVSEHASRPSAWPSLPGSPGPGRARSHGGLPYALTAVSRSHSLTVPRSHSLTVAHSHGRTVAHSHGRTVARPQSHTCAIQS